MTQIPDAPWVREAEMFGEPDYPEPICPICGAEAEYAYYDSEDNLLGCDNCITRLRAEYCKEFFKE